MNEQSDPRKSWIDEFYRDLNTLADTAFPKKCPKCGKTYQTCHDFLTQTTPVKDMQLQDRSGLFSMEGASSVAAIGVFRNCVCGSTLMADFHDRRDGTEEGHKRRQHFSALVNTLVDHGVNEDDARRELRNVLRGKDSSLLQDWLREDIIKNRFLRRKRQPEA